MDDLVARVFSSVAKKYDVMNDVMSFGIHRIWKKIAIEHCNIQPGQLVLDLAGGTGDLSKLIYQRLENSGRIILADINRSMLEVGRQELIDKGFIKNISLIQVNGEVMPFSSNIFDCIIIGFGLRNISNKSRALEEMYRVLKPGGKLIVLEFSKPTNSYVNYAYDLYSHNVIPKLGKLIAGDSASYQYLVDSIRRHPPQDELKNMILDCGFDKVTYHNLSGGICAIHKGYKF